MLIWEGEKKAQDLMVEIRQTFQEVLLFTLLPCLMSAENLLNWDTLCHSSEWNPQIRPLSPCGQADWNHITRICLVFVAFRIIG